MIFEASDLVYSPNRRSRFGPVSLSVEPGQLVGLVGPNGSGKSTLLRALVGLRPRLGGSVRIDGQDANELSRREMARRIAYLPQSTPSTVISVTDALMTGRTAHMGFNPGPADYQAVERVIDRLNLHQWRDRPLDELSGGERQKVLIGRALVQGSPLVVLDEPVSHLDVRYKIELYMLLEALSRNDGLSFLCAEHDLSLTARFASTVHVLAAGKIVASGPPNQALSPTVIREVFGVDIVRFGADGAFAVTGLAATVPGRD